MSTTGKAKAPETVAFRIDKSKFNGLIDLYLERQKAAITLDEQPETATLLLKQFRKHLGSKAWAEVSGALEALLMKADTGYVDLLRASSADVSPGSALRVASANADRELFDELVHLYAVHCPGSHC